MRIPKEALLVALASATLLWCGGRSDLLLGGAGGQAGVPDGSIPVEAGPKKEAGVDAPVDSGEDASVACDAGLESPRPVAPLSTSTVTSQRPVLRWALAAGTDGALVDVCRDRGCASVVASFTAAGSSGSPADPLSAGVYFWRVRGTRGGSVVTPPGPTWQLWVGRRSAPVDTSWGTVLDVNGDGFADVAVGAWGASNFTGKVYVYLGGTAGLSTTATTTLIGPDGPGYFGSSVASAGDVNGDGFADLVVGAYDVTNYSGVGAAYLYLGGPKGLDTAPASVLEGADGLNAQFGISVASAGDVDGDGYADVVVGSWKGVKTGTPSAHARVFLGGPCGLTRTLNVSLDGPAAHADDRGISVASAGDVNGDGFADVLVGANGTDAEPRAAYLYLGSASGPSASPDAVIASSGPPGGTTGAVASAGDVNGDGYADVVLGADSVGSGAGQAFVFLGGAGGLSTTPATTLSEPAGQGAFGIAVASAGDVNGDGFADVVVGGGGRAYVFLGGGGGVNATPASSMKSSDKNGGDFGNSAAGAGDLNGDGYADVVIGAASENAGVGSAYTYPGSAEGTSIAPATALPGPDGTIGEFGGSVARAELPLPEALPRAGDTMPA